MLNQTVLLRGVENAAEVLGTMLCMLNALGINPYAPLCVLLIKKNCRVFLKQKGCEIKDATHLGIGIV